MKRLAGVLSLGFVLGVGGLSAGQMAARPGVQEPLPPIRKVEIGPNASLQVNGKPLFPLMLWLQGPNDFPLVKELGHNVLVGYPGDSGGLLDYAREAWKANLYFVPSFDADYPASVVRKMAAQENMLGWIQGDEPDMTHAVSAAVVVPGKNMNVNPSTPFSRVVDGDTSSWTVLEPLAGGEFTIKLRAPVTVQGLAIWLTTGSNLSVGKDVVFLGDGKEVAKATLENKDGRQKVELQQPATFQALTVRFTSEYPGENKYGSVGEVEAFDKDGRDVLLSKPRQEPRTRPEEVLAAYNAVKALDKVHPVFMNLTSSFMKVETAYDQATKDRLYPPYAKGCDVMGFDTYPIYGTAMFGHILWPADGTAELRRFARPGQPLYAWIETNRGSQWITPAKQPEVKPEYTRFETWSCIIRGAAGIGYFTHKWKDPDGKNNYMSFAPKEDPAMGAELKRLNGQITRLSGAILAAPAKEKIEMKLAGGAGELSCHFKATSLEGAAYLFAQNTDLGKDAGKLEQFEPFSPRAGKATIMVEGLKAGTKIEVVDEARTITSEEGEFADEFGPLQEHIYRIVMDER